MIKKSVILIIALLILTLAGCTKGAPDSNSDSKTNSNIVANPATPNSGSSAQANGNASTAVNSAASGEPADPAKLLGTYQMVQVQKAGVVNMLSQARSEITFLPEGTYSRLSKVNDKVIHDDQGQFRIEGGEYLVLTIQVSKKNIHNPPLEKRHKISLSRDGEELKMISENGDIAVFHKIRKT
ncbi:MAG: hypothetical protein WBV94_20530 [Blastocatellia bacterium]